MQPDEAVSSAIREFEMQVPVYARRACMQARACQPCTCMTIQHWSTSSFRHIPSLQDVVVLLVQGVDLTGIIKTAGGGSTEM